MRQSSGAEKAHKHAETRAATPVQSTLAALGVTGAVLAILMLWLGRAVLAGVSTREVFILLGLTIGAGLLLGVILVAVLVLPALGRDVSVLADRLSRAADGDYSAAEQRLSVSSFHDRISAGLQIALTRVRDQLLELRGTSRENAARAQELSAHCGGLAATSIRTLEQSATAVHHGQELVAVSEKARAEAGQLAQAGAQAATSAAALRARYDGVVQLTRESIARLDASVALLGELSDRVRTNSDELTALAAASAEIRTFVVLVRKMARQSKLLALNAAMEAARAGEQGSGFAVVAGEVRRLAHSSNEAAERTDALVNDVLGKVSGARETSESAMEAARNALEATERGRASLQLLLDGALARPEELPVVSMDPSALGALVVSTLDEALRGARAALMAMRDVDGGIHGHRDRAHELAAAGGALARQMGKAAASAGVWTLDAAAATRGVSEPNEAASRRGTLQRPFPAQA